MHGHVTAASRGGACSAAARSGCSSRSGPRVGGEGSARHVSERGRGDKRQPIELSGRPPGAEEFAEEPRTVLDDKRYDDSASELTGGTAELTGALEPSSTDADAGDGVPGDS